MLFSESVNIEKSYRDRTIVRSPHLRIYKGDRIGIAGRNGEGKTTLIKMLAGVLTPDAGTVKTYVKTAYIPQLERAGSNGSVEEKKWLVPDGVHLSGGEETRRKIAAAFDSDAELIFADEPTSHLDMAGVEQLEKELGRFEGAVILISHDRKLLDNLCTSVWEVNAGAVSVYDGNYSSYVRQKQLEHERQRFEYEQYEKEKARLEQVKLDRSERASSLRKAPKRMGNSEARLHKRSVGKQKAKLDKGAKAIQSRIEQLDVKVKPREESEIVFDITAFPELHSRIAVRFDRFTCAVAGKTLFSDLTGAVKPGTKVAVTGKNGSGKSTLLQTVYGSWRKNQDGAFISEDAGVSAAKPVKMGFFFQQLENLNHDESILGNVMETTRYSETFVRTVLARLLFKREDVHKKVGMLSGGERVKTSLVKVFLGDYNVLLLDEPTNFLDLAAKEALQDVLKAYPGTIIFVTHDRYMVEHLAEEVIEIKNGGARLVSAGKAAGHESTAREEEESMSALAVEIRQSEVLAKLGEPQDDDGKARLEAEFERLVKLKRQM